MEDSTETKPSDTTETQSSDKVCNFFRKPSKNKNIRKRTTSTADDAEENDEDSAVVNKKKKQVKPDNKLSFATAPPKQSTTNESVESNTVTRSFVYESSREIQTQHDSRATATLETETDFSNDARAIRERVLKQADKALKRDDKNSSEEKLYKGLHGYTDHKAGFRREQTIAGEKAGGSHGPLRASAHIRVSARFDYQPDICKDYKETGYCGFGDSCKFMHDRGDYKSGWQMEREWDEKENLRKKRLAEGKDSEDEDGSGGSDDEDEEGGLPFACFICRRSFVDPVVTKCKHYFCEHCALKHHRKNKRCFVCNEPTLGLFNTAHEIKKKMAADALLKAQAPPEPEVEEAPSEPEVEEIEDEEEGEE